MRLLCAILCISWFTLAAQDSLKVKKLQYSGYLKDLQSSTFPEDLANVTTGNLIHNRFNLRWQPSGHLTGSLEVRTRLFWGEEISLVPNYSSQLRNRNEALDLTWNLVDEKRIILNTTVDRLWMEYRASQWNVRLGRQRINWGIGTTWNPNDLFNTYNFLDFDYEERPGADGFKCQRFIGDMDHIELAVSYSERSNETIAAARYFKNVAGYDLQLITGLYEGQGTVGMGWSGSIRETGFKGEFQYYLARKNFDRQFNLVMEADHVFQKGWYVSAGALLNSAGVTGSKELIGLTTLQLSPKNLMPAKWNTLVTFAKEISPLVSINTSIIYTPQTRHLILLPSVNYSLTENIEASLFWQSFFHYQGSAFDDLSHRSFFRLKWSY